jgi:hypothetical protein
VEDFAPADVFSTSQKCQMSDDPAGVAIPHFFVSQQLCPGLVAPSRSAWLQRLQPYGEHVASHGEGIAHGVGVNIRHS